MTTTDDRQQLRKIALKMLSKLDGLVDDEPDTADAVATRQKLHDWLFGGKTSMAATLVTLTELILKLQEQKDGMISELPTEAELARINNYLQRMETLEGE